LAYFGRSQTKLVWSRQRFQICTSSFAVKYETCRIFSILAFSVLEDESKWHYSEKWEGYCVVHREENVQSNKWGYLSANMACLVVVDQELISNTSVYVYYFVLDAKNKTCDICDSGIGLTKIQDLVNYLWTISDIRQFKWELKILLWNDSVLSKEILCKIFKKIRFERD